jgi:L-lactate dehydrogenase
MNNNTHRPVKIAVIGTGFVGSSFAFALLYRKLASEIVLIDANHRKAEGEAMDLNHAIPLIASTKIYAGTYADTKDAAMTVITAGSAQKPGETRLDLVHRNAEIMKSIVKEVVKYNPNGILLIASNPVDVMSYVAWKASGLPKHRVIGSGTILDTARFRYLLSQYFEVDPRSMHAYIIGEHGDSEVPVYSLANIAGMYLNEYCEKNRMGCPDTVLEEIFRKTRDAAYEIIERKGATYYAIGAGLVRIVEAILRDQNTVLTVSSLIESLYGINDVYLSLPTVLDHQGINRVLNINLSEDEISGLRNSAKVLHETINSLDLGITTPLAA